jgi:hypothetical protein
LKHERARERARRENGRGGAKKKRHYILKGKRKNFQLWRLPDSAHLPFLWWQVGEQVKRLHHKHQLFLMPSKEMIDISEIHTEGIYVNLVCGQNEVSFYVKTHGT